MINEDTVETVRCRCSSMRIARVKIERQRPKTLSTSVYYVAPLPLTGKRRYRSTNTAILVNIGDLSLKLTSFSCKIAAITVLIDLHIDVKQPTFI